MLLWLRIIAAICLCAFSSNRVFAQAVQIPPALQCFQATTGITGSIGTVFIVGYGGGGTPGTYANVPLTGGNGSNATANFVIGSGGYLTSVTILNPGVNYSVSDTLSASSALIGNTGGVQLQVTSTSINSSLAGGSVGMFIPGTLTVKQTWQNAAETILNQNPIPLDSNGCALMYGAGTYRQILYDNLGNEVWDQPTTVAAGNPYWAGLAKGTANTITVTDASFSGQDGQSIQFIAQNTNTGASTLDPSGYENINIVENSSTGPVALSGGEIVANNIVSVVYHAATNEFYLLNSANSNQASNLGVTPFNYGAKGDGITDDTTPITQWLLSGKPLYCAGKFSITTQINVPLPASGGIWWQGAGRQLCQIILNGASSGITISGGTPNFYTTPQIVLKDFSIVPNIVVASSPALTLSFAGGSGTTDPTVDIRNVDIKPSAAANYAQTCISLINTRNLTIDNVNCEGSRNGYVIGTSGISVSGTGQPVEIVMRGVNVYYQETGFSLTGTWQGISISASSCPACRQGVAATGSDNNENWLRVYDSIFTVSDYGVITSNIWNVQIYDNLTLLDTAAGASVSANHVCYQAQMQSATTGRETIHNNSCDGLMSTSGGGIIGVVIGGYSSGTMASNTEYNILTNLNVGTQLQAGTTGVIYGPQNTSGVTTPLNNLATSGANGQIAPSSL